MRERRIALEPNPHYVSEEDLEALFAALSAPEEIKSAGRQFAALIRQFTDATADQAAAIRAVREAVLWAGACVTPPDEEEPDPSP